MSDNLAPLLRGVSPRNLHPLGVSDTHPGAPCSVVRFFAPCPLACPRIAVVAGHFVATDHTPDVSEWRGVGCAKWRISALVFWCPSLPGFWIARG